MIHNALICYSHVTLIWVTFFSILLFSIPFGLVYYVEKACLIVRYPNPSWFDRYFSHITIHNALICYIQVTPLIWATFLSILLFSEISFDLVYYDIWGLALVPIRGGSCYIVNCWLFLYLSLLFMLLIIWNLHLSDLVLVMLNLSLESWVQNLTCANWLYILLCVWFCSF